MQITIPTIESLIEPYKHYPKPIQHALLLVETHPAFSVLTKASRRVLKAMVTRCSRHNGAEPIFARVDRLAKEAGVCVKTVQRAIAFLKRLGWLAKISDGRDKDGFFTFRNYWFSEDLVSLLRLSGSETRAPETQMSDGAYIGIILKEDHPETPEEPASKKEVDLPPALQQAAEELAISPAGIAKLRGEAHRAGHDLAQVVAAVRGYVHKLAIKGGRAYRYLQATIAKGGDFAGKAAQMARVEAETIERGQDKDRTRKYAGQRFVNAAGHTIAIWSDGSGANITNPDGSSAGGIAGRDMQKLFAMIESGKLHADKSQGTR